MPATEESRIETLGVIAGGGRLPALLLHACDRTGIRPFIVAFEGQTDLALLRGRDHLFGSIGGAGGVIETLKEKGIRDLAMVGAVRRPTLAELKPDLRTAAFFARVGLKALGDDGLLKALRAELESDGFRIHGVQRFARELLMKDGPLGKYKPDREALADIDRGIEVLKDIGRLDIGQSVIVQQGIVLGVEAAEGTDELIRRCAVYKRKGRRAVLVKMAKPGQDLDLDLPSIGPRTVELCSEAGMAGIAGHAGNSLVLDADEIVRLADAAGVFVVGIE